MKREKTTLIIIQLKLMSRAAGVAVLVALLGLLSALLAVFLQRFGIDWNLPLVTMVLNLFVCGVLFSENVYSSKSERRRYRTMYPDWKMLVSIKNTAVTILLIIVPLPVLIAELSLFDATMEQISEGFLYLASALPTFLFIGNAVHWLTVDRPGFVETLLITGLQSGSVFISSVPYLTITSLFDSRVALISVSAALLICCRFLLPQFGARLIMHHFNNVVPAYE